MEYYNEKNKLRKTKPLLSICIPTYNRKKELIELVYSILSLNRNDVNIVITDNCSNDGTYEKIVELGNNAVSIFRNENQLPALINMIQSIFNCNGKYIFYCNDRDIIIQNSLLNLIEFLKDGEYSFVYTTKRKKPKDWIGKVYNKKRNINTGKIQVFNKGYESLINQEHTHHPTGMVFNGDYLHKYLDKDKYFKHIDDMFTYSFLMRDELLYGPSVIFDCGCWDERDTNYFIKNKGRSVYKGILYFYPETPTLVVKSTLNQCLKGNPYNLSKCQMCEVGKYILIYFYCMLVKYKYCMWDEKETMHYGIKKEFISTKRMLQIYKQFFHSTLSYMKKESFDGDLINYWKGQYKKLYHKMAMMSLKADLGLIRLSAIRKKELEYESTKC